MKKATEILDTVIGDIVKDYTIPPKQDVLKHLIIEKLFNKLCKKEITVDEANEVSENIDRVLNYLYEFEPKSAYDNSYFEEFVRQAKAALNVDIDINNDIDNTTPKYIKETMKIDESNFKFDINAYSIGGKFSVNNCNTNTDNEYYDKEYTNTVSKFVTELMLSTEYDMEGYNYHEIPLDTVLVPFNLMVDKMIDPIKNATINMGTPVSNEDQFTMMVLRDLFIAIFDKGDIPTSFNIAIKCISKIAKILYNEEDGLLKQ